MFLTYILDLTSHRSHLFVSPFQGSIFFFTLLPRAHLLSSSSRGGSTWAKPCQASGLGVEGIFGSRIMLKHARPPALF